MGMVEKSLEEIRKEVLPSYERRKLEALRDSAIDFLVPLMEFSKGKAILTWLGSGEVKAVTPFQRGVVEQVAGEIEALPQSAWDNVKKFFIDRYLRSQGKWLPRSKKVVLSPRAIRGVVTHELTHAETTARQDRIEWATDLLARIFEEKFGSRKDWPRNVRSLYYWSLDPDEHVARMVERKVRRELPLIKGPGVSAKRWQEIQNQVRREVEPWTEKMLGIVEKRSREDLFRYSPEYYDILTTAEKRFGGRYFPSLLEGGPR